MWKAAACKGAKHPGSSPSSCLPFPHSNTSRTRGTKKLNVVKDRTGWNKSHYFELFRKKSESYCNSCSCLQESREEAEGWRKPISSGGRWEAEAKITGKEILQGRCLLQVKRGTLTNIFRSLLQSLHIWGNSSVQMCVILKSFSVKPTTCHRIIPTFKHCYKPKTRWEVSNILLPSRPACSALCLKGRN